MQHVREKMKMMSVNQMTIYQTILEAFNINRNSASERIKMKWADKHAIKYFLRSVINDLKIPKKPIKKCTGFIYFGAKLFNSLPSNIKEFYNSNTFKALIKKWIWQKIPSYYRAVIRSKISGWRP